jgi:hypothetical protein
LTPVPSPSAASARPEGRTATKVHKLLHQGKKKQGIERTHFDILQPQHALLDRILNDKALHPYVLFLPKTMNAIIRLRFRGVVPRKIHTIKVF